MLQDEGGLTLSVPGQPASKQTFLGAPTCTHAVFPSVWVLRATEEPSLWGMRSTAPVFPAASGSLPESQSQPGGGWEALLAATG